MEVFDIRRGNLALLLGEIKAAELSRTSGVAASYISRCLRQPGEKGHKTIGELTARKLEKGAKKSQGWLDQFHYMEQSEVYDKWIDQQPPVATEPHPKYPIFSVPVRDNGLDLYQAIERIAWAISKSQYRGSEALIGVLASMGKDPENQVYTEMLERLLSEKQDAPQKAASRAG